MTADDNHAARNFKSSDRSDFALRIQYRNTLPDLTYDTKSIINPMGLHDATAYKQTSLEREYSYELNFEDDILLDVDLVNIDMYKSFNSTEPLHPTDSLLLKDETPLEKVQGMNKKTDVSWLRRPDIIRAGSRSQKSVNLIERTIIPDSKLSTFKNKYRSRDEQIEAITKTFEDAKVPVNKHYESSHLTPVKTHYVYPDDKFWKHTISLVTFDSAPSYPGQSEPLEPNQIEESLLRGMSDKNGQYVGFFLKDPYLSYQDDPNYMTYKLGREYNWTIKQTTSGMNEDVYIWRIDPDGGVYYNDISAKVQMAKRRIAGGKIVSNINNTLLTISNREPTLEEIQNQNYKSEILLPIKNDGIQRVVPVPPPQEQDIAEEEDVLE